MTQVETFNNFNHVEDVWLQAYNRLVVATNIKKDMGKAAFMKYIIQFDQKERSRMFTMSKQIEKYGFKHVKKAVSTLVVVEDE